MGLPWRQANTQFMARQATLKLDKDFKDLDDEGTEDPRQADRVEQRLDIKRTGLQNANDTLVTAMFESFAGAAEFDFIASLPYVVARSLPPHYGAIVDADLEHWHRQPFGIILHELIKARRTTLTSSVLAFSLSLYRHPFIYILFSSRFTFYNKNKPPQKLYAKSFW